MIYVGINYRISCVIITAIKALRAVDKLGD